MTNKEIANEFRFLGDIMELHGENPFKIRSYQNAYITLRKLDRPLAEMDQPEMEAIKGVGKAIAEKIGELLQTGKMSTLEQYREKTPEGVQEMLTVKGFGPKKVQAVWKDLGIETVGELLYAVNENRLIELKGFGQKTQEELKQKLEYFQRSQDQFHFSALESAANNLVSLLESGLKDARIDATEGMTEGPTPSITTSACPSRRDITPVTRSRISRCSGVLIASAMLPPPPRISDSRTFTPRRASCHAASLPASPPPMMCT